MSRITNRSPTLNATAAVWLALAASCAPTFAQGASPLDATLPQAALSAPEARPDNSLAAEGESSPQCEATLTAIQHALVLAASAILPSSPAFAQNSPNSPKEKRPEKERSISYGVEIKLSSGHADRGIVISDRPVVQPVTWVSSSIATFSVWSNLTLAETTDGSRPQILEMELTRAHEWRNLTIEPAIRMFFYRDRVSIDSARSIEGWLYLSYEAGPFRLFTNQSIDVLTYKGGYFGTVGIALDRRVSPRVEVGGSFDAGWASSTFNDAYVGIDKSAFNLIRVEGWLTAHVKPHLYIGPYFEFNTIVDRAVRAALTHPTVLFVGLTTGVEF